MIYLGVDGGGTKTNFLLTDAQGRVISFATKLGCNYSQVPFAMVEQILTEGINEVCTRAGLEIRQISYSFLGLPAFGEIAKDVLVLEGIVKKILQNNKFRCGNDVEAGWAGSLACQPGINLVGGTGSIGFGRDQAGNTIRVSGWGYFGGDEGSAYWLGKELISLFSKEADGRLEKTPLYNIVRQEFNLTVDFDFISVLYDTFELKREEIAKLALLVHQAAQQGDENALTLFDRAAYEHSLTIKAIMKQLHFQAGTDILVSYSGGVFKAGDFILVPLKKYITGENTKLIKPILQPVIGAALYAMQLDGRTIDGDLITELKKQEEVNLKS
jgi:N-acetylglucosamine kinase-like BadF-type ATPase